MKKVFSPPQKKTKIKTARFFGAVSLIFNSIVI